MWQAGDHCALRGIHDGRVLYVQSVIVVQDTPAEVGLLLMPGAQCMHPAGWRFGAHGDGAACRRWSAIRTGNWTLSEFRWHTNRFLLLLEPEKYYASIYVWEQGTGAFACYYINFQLPLTRSHCGFDTLDLELDIVAATGGEWQWKDVDDYQEAIQEGGILPEWVSGIERDQPEIFTRLAASEHPFDRSWLDWRPDPAWLPPALPAYWDQLGRGSRAR
jgi:protein associated with RNAse G/E